MYIYIYILYTSYIILYEWTSGYSAWPGSGARPARCRRSPRPADNKNNKKKTNNDCCY